MGAYRGADTLISFSVCKKADITNSNPSALTYLEGGMFRGKTMTGKWSDADVTADKSADHIKSSIVTFREDTLKVEGIAYDDAIYNQEALRDAILYPDATTQGGEPYMWIKLQHAAYGTEYFPVIGTSWEDGNPYDGGITFSAEFKSVVKRIKV